MKLIVTCEHGGNRIPKTYEKYFKGYKSILNSHRGYDLGAFDAFETLKTLADFSLYSDVSRLLIELNRSLHHPNLYSEFSKNIPKKDKQVLIQFHYLGYRNQIENTIRNWILNDETVLHLSVHSFTPVLDNSERNCDIGLLYDPKKRAEKSFCLNYKNELKTLKPNLIVRFNYPYLGNADGFTTYLRKQFSKNYIGIELEINQKYSVKNKIDSMLKTNMFTALKAINN
ncbi:MAG: N-formylglutamate amidohydrolase [Flaviramulus sp.]|nr:N-formylglutamate amidohydrolase [Flaviramulus sp.]NNC51013.1 N-formylglutamate amidohydrolase [Flaviramulus sp.]